MYQEEYFQGDIVMPVSDFVALNEDNAVVETSLWPGGRIYYTMSDCRDMNKSCLSWAERGECGRNPSYMHVYCRLSCSLCQAPPKPPPSPCKDNNSNCAGWASAGECYKNPSYMLVVCKLSCNKC
ncbi:putative tyrosinase-like protein tyr-3 [Amphibalanus amphitrite]|uniref:Putative tyrosinase-like protein tyr-3 n=1 Tax=Amphibalanus amphitrite TaxID=1232801 RepID=A0A6A4XCQ4_AMPAM|nr:putative tyrosinase-like protein tyr-3 [Amphibalanus amphitrite]